MNERLDEQNDSSDIGSRIEAWLEAELDGSPVADPRVTAPRPDVSRCPVDVTVKVAEAVVHGRRLRARRRAAAAGAVATGLVAASAAAVAVLGAPTVTTTPRPPASPSSTPSGISSERPSGTTGTSRPGVGPIDVAYPQGTGTFTVTWPAPASGNPWLTRSVEQLSSDDVAFGFRDAVGPSLGVRPADPGGAAVFGIEGVPSTWVLSYDAPSGDSTVTAVVVVSRGGGLFPGSSYDECGAWPAGVAGLGGPAPKHPERCRLVEEPAEGGTTYLVHRTDPAAGGAGPQRTVFTVRPDGVMVQVHVLADKPGQPLPDWDALDTLVRELRLPVPGRSPIDAVDVRYPIDGATRTVRWPAPAARRAWFAQDPQFPVGRSDGPESDGALDLERSLLAAVPGSSSSGMPGAGGHAIGLADGQPTAYFARVAVPGATVPEAQRTTWTVRTTRGGVSERPLVFDLCGEWPAGYPGLAMTAQDRSVWFEDAGTPRQCSLAVVDGVTVVHLTVPSAQARGAGDPPPGPAQAYAFTVRPDGTAFAAQVVALVGSDPATYLDRLDRLVLDLPYPSRR